MNIRKLLPISLGILLVGFFIFYAIKTSMIVSDMDMAKQDYVCKDNGGVYQYTWDLTVECRNGANYEWRRAIISEEFYPDPREQ